MLLILLLARRIADAPAEKQPQLDVVGAVLSALGLALVVFGVLRSAEWGWIQPKAGGPSWAGLSPTVWLVIGGLLVIWAFFRWESYREERGLEPLVRPAMLQNRQLSGGLTMFFFQYLVQAGFFFVVPLFLSVCLGLSALDTGVRLLPLSVTLLAAAIGIPVLPGRLPAPRRPRRPPLASRRDAGAPGGARPGRRGRDRLRPDAPDRARHRRPRLPARQRHCVGGARRREPRGRRRPEHRHEPRRFALGTALAGSLLIATLTSAFIANVQQSPAIPESAKARAEVELAGGIPFISDADLETALAEAGAEAETTEAALDAYADARLGGLKAALAILAVLAVVALFLAQRIPTRQPGARLPG